MQDSQSIAEIAALAERCDQRARAMDADVMLWSLEMAAVEAESNRRYQAYQDDKSDATIRDYRIFVDRKSALKGSIDTCREDAEHYRACATALRAHLQGKSA